MTKTTQHKTKTAQDENAAGAKPVRMLRTEITTGVEVIQTVIVDRAIRLLSASDEEDKIKDSFMM